MANPIPTFMTDEEYATFKSRISIIESNGNHLAKNPNSSATGEWQFIRSTWERLGFNWGDRFNRAAQSAAMDKLTEENAIMLAANGCNINYATLYGAHFLGASGLLRVMRGDPKDSITTVTSPAQRAANPTILRGTIKDFCDWLERKTGHSVYRQMRTDVGPGIPTMPQPENKPMFGSIVPILIGIFRHGLTAAGTAITGNGLATSGETEAAVGALVLLASFGWSVYTNWQQTRPK